MQRVDIDDPAPLLPDHVRQGVLATEKCSGQHHANKVVPAILREVHDRGDVLQAGVVYKDVEAPEFLDSRIYHPANFRGIGNIGRDEGACRAQGLNLGSSEFAGDWVKVGEHAVGAGPGKRFCDGVADSASRTRNHGNFSLHGNASSSCSFEIVLDMIRQMDVQAVWLYKERA